MLAFRMPRAIASVSIEVLAAFRVPHYLERIGDFLRVRLCSGQVEALAQVFRRRWYLLSRRLSRVRDP